MFTVRDFSCGNHNTCKWIYSLTDNVISKVPNQTNSILFYSILKTTVLTMELMTMRSLILMWSVVLLRCISVYSISPTGISYGLTLRRYNTKSFVLQIKGVKSHGCVDISPPSPWMTLKDFSLKRTFCHHALVQSQYYRPSPWNIKGRVRQNVFNNTKVDMIYTSKLQKGHKLIRSYFNTGTVRQTHSHRAGRRRRKEFRNKLRNKKTFYSSRNPGIKM